MKDHCVFCQIVVGTIPASPIIENDAVLAFLDIAPINPGHTLVIPKVHIAELSGLDDELGVALWRVVLRIERALRSSGIKVEGTNLFVANGATAGQEVFHSHIHVIPRLPDDGLHIRTEPGSQPSREELDWVAQKIRAAL